MNRERPPPIGVARVHIPQTHDYDRMEKIQLDLKTWKKVFT